MCHVCTGDLAACDSDIPHVFFGAGLGLAMGPAIGAIFEHIYVLSTLVDACVSFRFIAVLFIEASDL